jgi:hypothetical protein
VILSQLLPHPQQDVAPTRSRQLGGTPRIPAATRLETLASYPNRLSGQLCMG